MGSIGILAFVCNALVYVSLLLMLGALALRALVLRERGDEDARAAAARTGAVAAAVFLAAIAGTFTVQLLSFNLPPDPLWPDAQLLLDMPWGRAWKVQAALGILSLPLFIAARRAGDVATLVLALPVAALGFTPAFTGHAAGEEARVLSIAADGLHVLGAGAWIGTLAVLALTAPRAREGSGQVLLRRIRRFSPVALASAAVVATTGLASTWLRLERVANLWASTYGRWLALKLGLFAGVLALGYFNWRRGTPRLEQSGDPGHVRSSIRAELAFAAAILVVTAILLMTPLPAE